MNSITEIFIRSEIERINTFFKNYCKDHEDLTQCCKILDRNKKIPALVDKTLKEALTNLEADFQKYENDRYALFAKTVFYIFSSQEKNQEFKFKLHQDTWGSKNDSGGYNEVILFEFYGRLGRLLSEVSDFYYTGEVYFNVPKSDFNKDWIESLDSMNDFIIFFLENCCDYPDKFKPYFKEYCNFDDKKRNMKLL